MAGINVKPQYKEIVKLFSSLTGSKNMWQVFQDVIEMIALAIQNSVEIYPERFEENEKRYIKISSEYTKAELETVTKIFAEIVRMLEANPFQDLLGDLYMQLDMGSSALGQFFTPYSVSRIMALIGTDIEQVKKEISRKGFVSFNEPCIGGGVNAVAFCDVLNSNGINYQSDCLIIGQDLSYISSLMSYITLSLSGCQAVIKVANTLSDPYIDFYSEIHKNPHKIWYTPFFILFNGIKKDKGQR